MKVSHRLPAAGIRVRNTDEGALGTITEAWHWEPFGDPDGDFWARCVYDRQPNRHWDFRVEDHPHLEFADGSGDWRSLADMILNAPTA